MVNQRLIDDLMSWYRRISPCECSGIRLRPDDCYRLALVLECAHDSLLQIVTELEIERSRLNVLDPEGSRQRMEMQRFDGATPYEQRTHSPRGWDTKTDDPEGKPMFRNL